MPNTVVILENGTSLPEDIKTTLCSQGNVAIWPLGLDQAEAEALRDSLGWEPDRAIILTHPYADAPGGIPINTPEFEQVMDLAATVVELSECPPEILDAVRQAKEGLAEFFASLAQDEGFRAILFDLYDALEHAGTPVPIMAAIITQLLTPYPLLPER